MTQNIMEAAAYEQARIPRRRIKRRNISLAMQILQGAIYHFPCICSVYE
jgi:hypothetical protein